MDFKIVRDDKPLPDEEESVHIGNLPIMVRSLDNLHAQNADERPLHPETSDEDAATYRKLLRKQGKTR